MSSPTNASVPPEDAEIEQEEGTENQKESTPLPLDPESNTLLANALEQLSESGLFEVIEGLETLLVYARNLILFPDEKKYRKVKISNVHYQERLGHLPGAQALMMAIGYMPDEAGEYLRLNESKVKDPNNNSGLRGIEQRLQGCLNEAKRRFALLPDRSHSSNDYSFCSVRAASCHSAIGKRHNMEDDEIIVDKFCGDEKQGYFGLYDGHGGRATVDFVVKALHMNLEQELKRAPQRSLIESITHSYLVTDAQLRRQNILRSGSTSVTCIVRCVEQKRFLYTANVGDSRAVLCRGGKAIRLTIDHKGSVPEEAKRIRDAGGFIGRNKRVNGVLAISRALGDHMLKDNDVVSAVPYCTETELSAEDTFLLLACDGVWDVMSDQEAVDFLLAKMKSFEDESKDSKEKEATPPSLNERLQTTCKALVREALDRRSLDNVTVMIIKL